MLIRWVELADFQLEPAQSGTEGSGQSLRNVSVVHEYAGLTVLVTGGTGSFGRTVVNHLMAQGVDEVRVFSRDEAKQHDLRTELRDGRVRFTIGDVRDADAVRRVMAGVDLVFHAAALKQVPSCEFFPLEAVATNVIGSHNVIEAAIAEEVDCVVCLGTDKAVLPINAMGMSKGLMEKLVQARARSDVKTRVCSVRYGNVLYSRGSVLPHFVAQIFKGEALTLTDPEMTRFLLPLPAAVDLVETAFFHGQPGDTLIRKAPAATVGVLAEALNHLFGEPVPTVVIGTRHSEKLFETLATAEELSRAEDLGDYWRLRPDSRGLNYDEYFDSGELRPALEDYHSHNTKRLEVDEVVELLLSLPEIQRALTDWADRGL